MKTVSSALQAALYSANIQYRANLYTLELAGPMAGVTLRMTDGEQDLVCEGMTYVAGLQALDDPSALSVELEAPFGSEYVSATTTGGVISRSRSRMSSDLSIDDVDVELNIGALSNALSAPVNALVGSFDGCGVTIRKAFMEVYGDCATNGAVLDVVGTGYVADVSSTRLRLTVKSIAEILATPLPKRLIQANCPYVFGGPGCNIVLATYTTACTAGTGSTASSIVIATGSATHASQYSHVTFTSGALVGMTRQLSGSGSPITLAVPFPSAPNVGDTFNLVRGCNKTRNGAAGDTTHDCLSYSNLVNFGGFPDVPAESLSSS